MKFELHDTDDGHTVELRLVDADGKVRCFWRGSDLDDVVDEAGGDIAEALKSAPYALTKMILGSGL